MTRIKNMNSLYKFDTRDILEFDSINNPKLNLVNQDNCSSLTDIHTGICTDYPDPDVIRVGNIYYMVTTTMYFCPGCEIFKSTDLINWDHACYVYEKLDSTDGQTLQNNKGIYGRGMWAATIRYHKGCFYIMFVCNDTHKTYLYTLECNSGILDDSHSFNWTKRNVEGFYHDCSLLFDEDANGKEHVYVVYGNTNVYLTELKNDMSSPLEGGLNKLIVSDAGNKQLGYEGSHLYKINGKYYLFLIHSTRDSWKRTEACFVSDSIDGEFVGSDVLNDDMGFFNSGIAQGGIVDTPDGQYYAILFQDRQAIGRIPVLVNVHFENDYPVFEKKYSFLNICNRWQFNHEPDWSLLDYSPIGNDNFTYSITTDKICHSVQEARNTLTNRLYSPVCDVEIDMDFSALNNGDVAGLCILQGCHGFIGIKKENDTCYLFTESKYTNESSPFTYNYDIKHTEKIPVVPEQIRLGFTADFTDTRDIAQFYYYNDDGIKVIIPDSHKMLFKLDHFTGNRTALFLFSEEQTGGKVTFSNFKCTIKVHN